MADVEKTDKRPFEEDEIELVSEPAELVEEDLEDVAGGGCGGGKGCCDGSSV